MILPGVAYPEVIAFARAWDADFITPDMKVVANSKAMVTALNAIRDLYEAGRHPAQPDRHEGGRRQYLDAERPGRHGDELDEPQRALQRSGEIPGRRQDQDDRFPRCRGALGKYEVAPTKVEFWSMAIPKNSQNKDLAWKFIKAMSSHRGDAGGRAQRQRAGAQLDL